MFIERDITTYVLKLVKTFPVVMITGPRQSGKSTLVKHLFPTCEYITLDNFNILSVARADPIGFISSKKGTVIIDEAQKAPFLFDTVKMIVDRDQTPGKFILTGSNQPELFEKVSESLAGRVGIAELLPLSLSELKNAGISPSSRDSVIHKGFMPRLVSDEINLDSFFSSYFRTYVERDVRKIINIGDLDVFETFVQLLAGRAGQLVNKQSLAKVVGVSEMTIARWITVLKTSYIVFTLRPYFNNFGKRITKTPKIYFTDTGLAAYLLGIRSPAELATHPLMGNLFENMVVADALKTQLNSGRRPNMYFYRNSSGSIEVDLLVDGGNSLDAYEIKASATFKTDMTKNLKSFASLSQNVRRFGVIYSGDTIKPLATNFADTKDLFGLDD